MMKRFLAALWLLLAAGWFCTQAMAQEQANSTAVDPEVSALTQQLGDPQFAIRQRAQDQLVKLGFSVGPVQNAKEVHDCAHLEARRAFIEIDVAGKKIRAPGAPVRMSQTPARVPTRAPHLGEHTDEVLRRLLGYSDEQTGLG